MNIRDRLRGCWTTCTLFSLRILFHCYPIDSINDEGPSKYVKDLREALKTYYENKVCKKQLLPWERPVELHDIYVQLTIDMEISKPGTVFKKRLESYDEIFQDKGPTGKTRRFILEGRPGLGKSTLCAKIAYDWTQGLDNPTSPLNHIKLLFILALGKVHLKSSIEQEIIQQLLYASESKFRDDPKRLKETIESLGKSVVIVLDALDESAHDLLPKGVGSVASILKFETLSSCRVLVTSRPWRVNEMMKLKVYQRLELQPFTKESILKYVQRYFSADDQQTRILRNRLKKLIEDNELVVDASIPLIILLICWYWKETEGKEIPRRRCELYDAIISNMYQYVPERPEHDEVSSFDIFKVRVLGK